MHPRRPNERDLTAQTDKKARTTTTTKSQGNISKKQNTAIMPHLIKQKHVTTMPRLERKYATNQQQHARKKSTLEPRQRKNTKKHVTTSPNIQDHQKARYNLATLVRAKNKHHNITTHT